MMKQTTFLRILTSVSIKFIILFVTCSFGFAALAYESDVNKVNGITYSDELASGIELVPEFKYTDSELTVEASEGFTHGWDQTPVYLKETRESHSYWENAEGGPYVFSWHDRITVKEANLEDGEAVHLTLLDDYGINLIEGDEYWTWDIAQGKFETNRYGIDDNFTTYPGETWLQTLASRDYVFFEWVNNFDIGIYKNNTYAFEKYTYENPIYPVDLFRAATNKFPPLQTEWQTNNFEELYAYSHLDWQLDDYGKYRKLVYRLKFRGEPGQQYTLEWYEREDYLSEYYPWYGFDELTTTLSKRSYTVTATGKDQYTPEYTIEPDLLFNESYQPGDFVDAYYKIRKTTLVLPKPCAPCESSCLEVANRSVDLTINLGRDDASGSPAGSIVLKSDAPAAELATPAALAYVGTSLKTKLLRDEYGTITQVKAPQMYLEITNVTDFKYNIHFYYLNSVSDPGGTNEFVVTNAPYQSLSVEVPDDATNTFKKLKISKTAEGATTIYDYLWTDSNSDWTLFTGGGLRKEVRTTSIDSGTGDEIQVRSVYNGSDNLEYKETFRFHSFPQPFGTALIEKSIDPDGRNLTTQLFYYDDPQSDGTNYGKLRLKVEPDGSWARFEYDQEGRTTKAITGFEMANTNAAENLCRVTEYHYDPVDPADDGSIDSDTPRTVIEKLLGTEISRNYLVVLPGEQRQIQCHSPQASPYDSANLITISKYHTEGLNAGQQYMTILPDGTKQIETRTTDDQLVIVYSGEADPQDEMNILSGTKTITGKDEFGRMVIRTVKDIETEITLSHEENTDFDEHGRSIRTTYLDGSETGTLYGCCGVEATTNRLGQVTTYLYDGLNRRTGAKQYLNANDFIMDLSELDAEGRMLSTLQYGTNGAAISLGASFYDVTGDLIASTNAMDQVTFFTNYLDSEGYRIEMTIAPDSSTITRTYNRDGSLKSATGTAVHPVRYAYGVESSGSEAGKLFSQEIKLNADGSDSLEWIKTYTDFLGRTFKVVYSDGASEREFFNDKGQRVKSIDADGVTKWFTYNGRGEQEDSVVDLDGDGISYATDRIMRSVSDVVENERGFMRRTQTYQWTDSENATPTLVSVNEMSRDGLLSWNSAFGNESFTVRTNLGGGVELIITTNPDSSYSITTNHFGRTLSVASFDSTDVVLSRMAYSYDAFGRVEQIEDLSGAIVTFQYDDLGRQTSVTRIPSGSGLQPQTTLNFYDSMGRVWKQVLTDGSSVTNEFYITGELKRTSGSRTYPVEYTYDAQGRAKTMKTWRDFSGNAGTATTTWNYDPYRGFLTSKLYADNEGSLYAYSPAGRLQTRIGARGIATTNEFNSAGERIRTAYSDSTPAVSFQYDRLGRIATVTNGSEVASFGYNDSQRLASYQLSGGPLHGLSLAYTYDELNRRTSVHSPSLPGIVNAYGYDNASRLKAVSMGALSATYSYQTDSSLVSSIQYRKGAITRLNTHKQYDGFNRLTNIVSQSVNSAARPFAYSYAYNEANQRASVTEADGSYWVYQYDELGQVISAKKHWSDGTKVAGQQFDYAFDDIGNRVSEVRNENPATRTSSYTANALNQYESRSNPGVVDVIGTAHVSSTVTVNGEGTVRGKAGYFHAPLSVDNAASAVATNFSAFAVRNHVGDNGLDVVSVKEGTARLGKASEDFTYDADGNLTSDSQWTYEWDAENRLIAMESAAGVPDEFKKRLEFKYDFQSRRTEKVVLNVVGTNYVAVSTNRFVYDGFNVLAELDGANTVTRTYLWGSDLSGGLHGAGGVGGLVAVAMHEEAKELFPAFDGNGNVVGLFDAVDGTVYERFAYGPFGQVVEHEKAHEGAASCAFGFSTKYRDVETGLLYYGFRFYDPSAGRWLNRDPIEEQGGFNLYGFVGNDGVNQWDFLGLVMDLVQILEAATAGVELKVSADAAYVSSGGVRALQMSYPTVGGHTILAKAIMQGLMNAAKEGAEKGKVKHSGGEVSHLLKNGQYVRVKAVSHASVTEIEAIDLTKFDSPPRLTINFRYQDKLEWKKHFLGQLSGRFSHSDVRRIAMKENSGQWLIPDYEVKRLANKALEAYSKTTSKPTLQGMRDYVFDASDHMFMFGKKSDGTTFVSRCDMAFDARGKKTYKVKLKIDNNGALHAYPEYSQ